MVPLIEIFWAIDDFCKYFEEEWAKKLLPVRKKYQLQPAEAGGLSKRLQSGLKG